MYSFINVYFLSVVLGSPVSGMLKDSSSTILYNSCSTCKTDGDHHSYRTSCPRRLREATPSINCLSGYVKAWDCFSISKTIRPLCRGTQRICSSHYLFPRGILLAGKNVGVSMSWLGNVVIDRVFAWELLTFSSISTRETLKTEDD